MLLFYLSLIETQEDKSKFEQLYYKYKTLMKYVAFQIIKDDGKAEDAVHEAFIKLTRYLEGIDEIECNRTKTFIVIVTRSATLDMLRKEKQDKACSLEDIEELGATNDDMVENAEAQEIFSIIKTLPDIHRDVIELKVYYELKDKEIADILGITNQAVRKRLQRARVILKNKLVEIGEYYVSV